MPLSDLAAALASATGPSRDLDVMLAGLVFYRQPQPIEAPVMCENAMQVIGTNPGTDEPWSANDITIAIEHPNVATVPAYTASLDAITGAIKARWPGLDEIAMIERPHHGGWHYASLGSVWMKSGVEGESQASVALALCLAAVRLAMAEEGK